MPRKTVAPKKQSSRVCGEEGSDQELEAYRSETRQELFDVCKDLSDGTRQAHALKLLTKLILSYRRQPTVVLILLAISDMLSTGNFAALSKQSRHRSVANWVKAYTAARLRKAGIEHGPAIDRFMEALTGNWKELLHAPDEIVALAEELRLMDPKVPRETMLRRLRRLEWDERELGKPRTPERVARAVVARSKFSTLEKRADRAMLDRED